MDKKELAKLVEYHQNKYYNETSEISDKEFDKLWDELKKKDPNNPIFFRVGTDNSSGFSKAKHIINMNSQEKVNNENDFITWWKRRINNKAIVQYKLDGISIELQYIEGKLNIAVTRGDGVVGDDITNNVKKMSGCIKNLEDKNFTGGVRGEIVLYKSNFEKYYKPQGYANPRNMASGLAKQKNGEGCEHLHIIVYDAQHSFDNYFKTENEKIQWLIKQKFFAVSSIIANNINNVISFRNKIILQRNNLPFDIDGLVIKNNEINYADMKRSRPEYQIAFKFDSTTETTELIGIDWSISGKIVTPIALFRPIVLDGTTVKRASLANPDEIRRLGICIGDTVVVSKRNEIIPKIEKVDLKGKNSKKIEIPTEIEHEGKMWTLKDEGTRLTIVDENFPLVKFHRLEKWIKKLDVKGFGPALLMDLFKKGFVNEISEFYTINLEKYLETTNLKKATRKAFNDLYNKSFKIGLAPFIAGFDIEGVGEGVIDFIVDAGYSTIDSFYKANERSLCNINGIGEDRAKRIVEGLKEHKEEIKKVLNTGKVTIKEKEEKKDMGALGLNGLTFCFTGALESMTRDEAFELVKSKGGNVKSSVTGTIDYLVTNTPDSGTGKNKKADSLGIPKITENEFLKLAVTR